MSEKISPSKLWDTKEKLSQEIEDLKKQGNIDEALNKNEELLQTGESYTDIEIWLNRAILLYDKGQTDEAKINFKNILMIDRKNFLANYHMAIIERDEGNSDNALSHIQDAEQSRPDDENIIFEYGLLLIDMGKYQEAIEKFSKIRDSDSNYGDSLSNIGYCLLNQKKYDDAYDKFFEAEECKKDQNEIYNLYHAALCLEKMGKPDEAIELIETKIEFSVRDGDTFRILSDCHYDKNEYLEFLKYQFLAQEKGTKISFFQMGWAWSQLDNLEMSKQCYLKALEDFPDDSTLLNNLSSVYNKLGEYDKAIEIVQNSLSLNPKKLSTWHNLADIYFSKKEYEKEIFCYEKILELEPEEPEAKSNIANAYYNLSEYEKSLETAKDAIKVSPEDGYNYRIKGLSLFKQDKLDEALECFETAIKKQPDEILNYVEKARTLESLEKNNEYEQVVDLILKKDANNVNALFMKAGLLIDKGEYGLALEFSSKLLKVDNRKSNHWSKKGVILHFLGQYDEAILYYKKSLEIFPQQITTITNLSKAYSNIGDDNQALDILEKALERDQTNTELLEWKAELLLHIKPEDGIQVLKKIVEILPDNSNFQNWLGWELAKQGNYSEALSHVEKSLEICDDKESLNYYATLHSKAYILMNTGNFLGAENLFEKIVSEGKRVEAVDFCDYAALLRRMNKNDKAIEVLKDALKEFPKESRIYFEIGDCFANNSQYAEEWENYLKAINLEPNVTRYYSETSYDFRDHGLSETFVDRALDLNEHDIVALYLKGMIMIRKKMNGASKSYFRRALNATPKSYFETQVHSLCAQYVDNEQGVRRIFENGVKNYPTTIFYLNYARYILEKKLDKNEAMKLIDKSLEIGITLGALKEKINFFENHESIEKAISFAYESINKLPNEEIVFLNIILELFSKSGNKEKVKEIRLKISELKDKK